MYPTIVTALFDLQRREGSTRRTADEYLDLAASLLAWPAPMVVFADPELVPRIDEMRASFGKAANTVIHSCQLEETAYYKKYLSPLERSFAEGRQTRGLHPEKDTPLYMLLQWLKVELVRTIATSNPLATRNIFWVDIGIHHVAHPPVSVERLLRVLGETSRPILPVFKTAATAIPLAAGDPATWYAQLRQFCAGGIWGGSPEDMLEFESAFESELENGCLPTHPSLDESILLRMHALGLLKSWVTVTTNGHHDLLTVLERRSTGTARKVCLCMMVKNESRVIRRALDSVADEIDGWCITDTGSTDGTPAIIEDYFSERNIPGRIHHTTFIDFGASRTETIKKSREFATTNGLDYLLLLDADEVVEVRDPEWKTQLHGSPYLLRYDDPLSYRTLYLVPADVDWHFVGRTHEYLAARGESPSRENFEGIVLHDHGDGGSKSDKFKRDVRLLSRTLEESPDDQRSVFYLAESFLNGNLDVARALELYTRRAAMGGFEEEAWYAAYRCGHCLERLAESDDEPWPAIVAYLKAWERRPWRAEPLTDVVRLAAGKSMHLLGAVVGEYALAHVIPREERRDDILFIDTLKHGASLHDWLSVCHYWAGFPERSRVLALKALNAMDPSHRARIEENIRFAEASNDHQPQSPDVLIAAVTRLRESGVPVAANMIAEAARGLTVTGSEEEVTLDYEQSICGFYSTPYREKAARLSDKLLMRRELPDGMREPLHANRWFHVAPLGDAILRARRIETEGLRLPPGYNAMNPSLAAVDGHLIALIRAVNYRIREDGSYEVEGPVNTRNFLGRVETGDRITVIRELNAPPMDESALRIRGFEDCRLFTAGGRVWAVANRAHPRNPGIRTMFLLEVENIADSTPEITRAVHLRGPHDEWHQKNWMPVDGADEITLIYSVDPTVILDVNEQTGDCSIRKVGQSPLMLTDVRGGSQLAPVPQERGGGFVAFVHGLLRERPRRSYFHQILRFDENLMVVSASRSFVLRERAIEFVSGCAIDGDEIVVTWGHNDSEAWTGRLALTDVLSLCAESSTPVV